MSFSIAFAGTINVEEFLAEKKQGLEEMIADNVDERTKIAELTAEIKKLEAQRQAVRDIVDQENSFVQFGLSPKEFMAFVELADTDCKFNLAGSKLTVELGQKKVEVSLPTKSEGGLFTIFYPDIEGHKIVPRFSFEEFEEGELALEVFESNYKGPSGGEYNRVHLKYSSIDGVSLISVTGRNVEFPNNRDFDQDTLGCRFN